jgi:predicted MFS family arabinose efflux permease
VTTETPTDAPAVPERRDFAGYLGGAALWLAGFNLQQFLVTWMLVGILLEPGTRVGLAQMLIALPGFVLMLFGGGAGDRLDGRRVLQIVHGLALIPPLALAALLPAGLDYVTVIAFGIAVGALQGLSEPSRVAMLNRVTAGHIHRTVVLTTVVTMTVGLTGTWLGGRIDTLGLATVLVLQALLFGSGGFAVSLVSPRLTAARTGRAGERVDRLAEVAEGLKVLWRTPRVRDVIALNFTSSIFNAGAWFVVYPFLVTRLYDGDAALLALLSLVFFAGSITSNLALLRFVPLARPGRLFLIMQLTRAGLFAILLAQPPIWVLALVSIAWGMNMGITTSTTRMMVQSDAPEAHRARVLSVFILSTMSAMPLGAVLLGTVVDVAGVLAGFVPGLAVSLALFVIGTTATGLWTNRAPGLDGDEATPVDDDEATTRVTP